MLDAATLTTIASITASFGVAMLFFRLQREMGIRDPEPNWIPWADWLLICATVLDLLLALLPVLIFGPQSREAIRLASGACAAASVLAAGYVFGILAHYRLFLPSRRRRGTPRTNPEPSEAVIVVLTTLVAILAGTFVAVRPA